MIEEPTATKPEAPDSATPTDPGKGESESNQLSCSNSSNSSGVIPIRHSLPTVKQFTKEMLPPGIADFVADGAIRLQIPMDYLAVACLAACAGALGGKYRIHPKQKDDWAVTPTIWAGLIGPPSAMKSACLNMALAPIHDLEDELSSAYKEMKEYHHIEADLAKKHQKTKMDDAAETYATDKGKAVQSVMDAAFNEPEPIRGRLTINDATVEKLGEILSENPNGLLLVRDELSGLLAKLSKEEYQADRAFFLECFEGNNRHTCDRISRGTIEIARAILSILGGIQPTKIAPIIQDALAGRLDDGLIQRFQLLVWPNVPKTWKWQDRSPDKKAYENYMDVIRGLHALPTAKLDEPIPTLRFSPQAQLNFMHWMESIQAKVRSEHYHPVMQAHLAKMPKTIAGLALLFELAGGGRKQVGGEATAMAIKWSEYLISHAERVYSWSSGQEIDAAKQILSRRGKLPPKFTARDIKRKNWTGLAAPEIVHEALQCLVDHRYLQEIPVPTTPKGGRSTTSYQWSPYLDKTS